MTRLVTTTAGLGRLDGDEAVLLDLPFGDLGEALRAGLSAAEIAAAPARARRPLAALALRAPVTRPGKIWAAGWSYLEHAQEGGREAVADEPFFFLKAPSAVTGPFDAIRLPAIAPDRVDYEGEIAVVIGRTARAVDEVGALACIAGVTAANDVSARDVQKGEFPGSQPNVSLGKSFDSFAPMGPCLATLDGLANPQAIGLRTLVDGELRQQARSSSLAYSLAAQVAYLSHRTTLDPGDVVLTGTPAGVGFHRNAFLRPGSVVEVEVEGVGTLRNVVTTP